VYRDAPFTIEQLESKWNDFAEQIKADRPRIATTMFTKKPVLRPGNIIELSLENSTLKEDFVNSVKPNLVAFLRNALLNDSITLNLIVDEAGENGKKKLYTPEDKFHYLTKKNPALGKLKQQFNLDFE